MKDVVEFGEARICRKAGDYWVKVTCFEQPKTKVAVDKDVGLDFGIETTVTTSDGEKLNCKVKQTRTVKLLNRGLHRKKKGSKNRIKASLKYEREFSKINNRKKDIRNKIVLHLTTSYSRIFIQDEQVASWQKNYFGRQVSESAIGGIIEDLKKSSSTSVVDQWFASTKLCNMCGHKNDVQLKDRIFHCRHCGHTEDRDIHSARNILAEGIRLVRSAKDVKTPVEMGTSVPASGRRKYLSGKQEATAL